jgi:hypothetical protein
LHVPGSDSSAFTTRNDGLQHDSGRSDGSTHCHIAPHPRRRHIDSAAREHTHHITTHHIASQHQQQQYCDASTDRPSDFLGMKDHLSPEGKPAPPRPRRPDALMSSTIWSGPIHSKSFVRYQSP